MKTCSHPKSSKAICRAIFFFFMYAASTIGTAQVFDNFSDGNFTSNPAWQGDTQQFQITNSSAIPPEMKPALQLNAEGSDTSYLVLPNTLMMNTEWHFWVKLSFNTSANNFARIYLVSDQEDLENELNGYFVQVGGTEDSIALYRQSGSIIDKLISGSVAYTGNSTNVVRIKVTHDTDNIWTLYSDDEGGSDFSIEGSVADNTFSSTAFFGLWCKYTSSNATKFYFDDFSVNEIIIDTIPPEIINVEPLSQTQLDLQFSEAVELNSAQNLQNYFVNTIGNPVSAGRDEDDDALVHLGFVQNFQTGVNYTLTVNDVEDYAGNKMVNATAGFQLEPPSEISLFDVVINEIMTDINPPPAGLPEADYLELFNRTSQPINLEGCTIRPRESSDPITFPETWIDPDSFLIVVQTSDAGSFQQYGHVVGLPGFTMNNEGQVVLRNPDGSLICSVNYTDDWYKDEVKKAGGWSLEQVDPHHPCSGMLNWTASVNAGGGTPGSENSVNGVNMSLPEIVSAQISGTNAVVLNFSHFIDSLSLVNKNCYMVNEGMGSPQNVIVVAQDFTSVTLEFSSAFQESVNYLLTISDTLFNCSGDFIPPGSDYQLIMPSEAGVYNIVINEIMADPDPPNGLPEFEYIEIYNTTSSFLCMENWTLQVGTTDKLIPSFIIEPGEYVIFTEDEGANLYGLLARSFGFSSLGLTNSGTSLKLINQNGIVISSVTYRDNWYGDADKSEGGWSLEQIDPANPCPGEENWTGSLDERGGSPGSRNSVFSQNPVIPVATKVISIDDKAFEVCFNQWMDEQTIINPAAYCIDRGVGHPVQAHTDGLNTDKVILEFSEPLQTRKLYTLTLTSDLKSCIGQPVIHNTEIFFGIPEAPAQNDIVINEVLFNPTDNGVDFVEIYNRSQKIIDLSSLQLGTIEVNQLEPNDTVFKTVPAENALLLTGQYLALSSDPDKINEQYFTPNPDGFVRMASFPAYNNDQGTVVLSAAGGPVVEAFTYSEEMHYPLLNAFDGVSLERIHFDRPASDPTNWHSASQDCGFATPAYQNSQYSESSEADDQITIEPEIFSPDNDGFDDVVNINYQFETPGYSCTITIFDAKGYLVNTIVTNEFLGTQGTFSWDGRTNANLKAAIGIYIIFVETYDLNGNIKRYKEPVVLAGKL